MGDLRQIISDSKVIDKLRQQFEQIDYNEDSWTATYLDRETGDKWLYYKVDTQYHGGGLPVIGKLPIPDTDGLIYIALHSSFSDEVFAACKTLADNENINGKEFRAKLVDQLERLSDKDRQKRIVELTGLDSSLNRRQIVGQTIDQVDKDSKYFQDIAERAKKLMR